MATIPTKNEIIPGLFQGNHLTQGTKLSELGIDVSVDLSVGERHIPNLATMREEGKQYIYYPIEDSEVIDSKQLISLAEYLNSLVNSGKKILIRCGEGHNRSGLLVALILMIRGKLWWEAVDMVRDHHEKVALNNQRFVSWLEHLDLTHA